MLEQENTFSTEDMNNFHWHMPGQGYRPPAEGDNSVTEGSIRGTIRKGLSEYGHLFDKPEEYWPEDKRGFIRELKVNLAIHEAIDEILATDEELAKRWLEHSGNFAYGGLERLREYVLRPIYVQLRQRFSYADLTG